MVTAKSAYEKIWVISTDLTHAKRVKDNFLLSELQILWTILKVFLSSHLLIDSEVASTHYTSNWGFSVLRVVLLLHPAWQHLPGENRFI